MPTAERMSDARQAVLLPSYNSGRLLVATVNAALGQWPRVIVVLDGSTDASGGEVEELARRQPGLEVHRLAVNSGKGAAVLEGMRRAAGITHALVMDADGQHPAHLIPSFFQASAQNPKALIAGQPVFGVDAPRERVWGRRVGNSLAWLETLGLGARDSLFGFRVYPVAATREVLEPIRWGRRFDFDTVAAVRLSWAGVPVVNLPAPVSYPAPAEGGISHFRYLRDNAVLAVAHGRLLAGLLYRLPRLLARRWASRAWNKCQKK